MGSYFFFPACGSNAQLHLCGVFPLRICLRKKNKDFHVLHHCIMNIKCHLQLKRQSRSSTRPKTTCITVLSANERKGETFTYAKFLSAKNKWMTFVLFQLKKATFEDRVGIRRWCWGLRESF